MYLCKPVLYMYDTCMYIQYLVIYIVGLEVDSADVH